MANAKWSRLRSADVGHGNAGNGLSGTTDSITPLRLIDSGGRVGAKMSAPPLRATIN